MKHPEMCEHENSPLYCKKCGQEVFDAFLNVRLQQAKQFDCIISEEELDISSPEFLRQT